MSFQVAMNEEAISDHELPWVAQVSWAFLWLGVILRVVTFALCFPLWGDEAFVAANFLNRGYADLLRPLDYGQVCPLFFLWIELTAVKLLGFSEWSLRLVPTIASVASVFIFGHLASRVCRGPARVLAVAIFAVAYYPIRHGAEVKQYATDLLAALVLLALAIEWWRAPKKPAWLWALVATVPFALGLSHPAIFVAGGLSAALLAKVWKARGVQVLLPFAVYNVVMVATFCGLFVIFTSEQERVSLDTMRSNYWADAFPPLTQPGKFLSWLLETHTGRMFAYPFGDARGGSSLTTICFAAGLVALWRSGQKAIIAMALAPLALTFVAASLGRYPYGGSARTMIFAAPMICLLAGLGLAVLLGRFREQKRSQRVLRATLCGLALCGIALLGTKLAYPYKSVADLNSRAFARSFWVERSHDAELVCAKSDLGLGFNRRNWTFFRSALYLCNQKIYSPRHQRGVQARWETVSAEKPLRCVLYNEWPEKNAGCAAWLEEMSARFEMRKSETFIINQSAYHDDGTDIEDRYTVFEFVPRRGQSASQVARGLSPTGAGRRY
jgi:hypothetical protein